MKPTYIKVDVKDGLFSSEKIVNFDVGSEKYSLIVDSSDIIEGDKIQVRIIDETPEYAVVDLPNETFTSGNRVKIQRNLLVS